MEKNISVRMDGKLYEQIVARAEADCCSVSSVIKRACKQYLNRPILLTGVMPSVRDEESEDDE